MVAKKEFITKDFVSKIAGLFNSSLSSYSIDFQTEGSSGKVFRLSLLLKTGEVHDLIIRPEIPEFKEFYEKILLSYKLDYPQVYGFLTHNYEFFVIQKYISHEYADYTSTRHYYVALEWLIKKDRVLQGNIEKLSNHALPYLHIKKFYGLREWYGEIFKSFESKNCPLINEPLINSLQVSTNLFEESLYTLENSKNKTIIHGDLSLHNFLFTNIGETFVIDWTQPRIGSVAVDLASIIDSAPNNLKKELFRIYQDSFSTEDIDAEYKKAVKIRNLSYFAWMALMFNNNEGKEIDLEEMSRVRDALQNNMNLKLY